MDKEFVSQRQGVAMIIFFLYGSTALLTSIHNFGKHAWLSVLLAGIITLFFQRLYADLLKSYPDEDFYGIMEIAFGKLVGKVVQVLYILYFLLFGAKVLKEFGEFITVAAMPETPQIVLMIFVIGLSIWVVGYGIEVIGRTSEFFIYIGVATLFISVVLLIPVMNLDNIRPVLNMDMKRIAKGILYITMFPFGQIVVFAVVFQSYKRKESLSKVFMMGIVITTIMIAVTTITDNLVLTANRDEYMYFPTYTAIGRINIGDFLQRLEIVAGIIFTISGWIKVSICLFVVLKGIGRLMNIKDYRTLTTPVGLILLILSYILFDNTEDLFRWIYEIYPYFAFPFQVLIPVALYILIKIRKKKGSEGKA